MITVIPRTADGKRDNRAFVEHLIKAYGLNTTYEECEARFKQVREKILAGMSYEDAIAEAQSERDDQGRVLPRLG